MGRASLARSRQSLSPIRHDGPFRTFGLDAGPLVFAPSQPPGWSHLVMVRSGTATLRAASALAFVDPATATWVPEGLGFALELHGPCALRIAYVANGFAPPRAFGSVSPSTLLVEIVERTIRLGYLDPAEPRDARMLAVACDELRALETARGCDALAMPRDPGLVRAIEFALRCSDRAPSVAELANVAACSLRTFERLFTRETGLAPRAWFRRARLYAASAALASGASVTEAGFASGYTSPSAFVAAYKSVFGITPGRALRR
jgi:AraC-like DNA-binding protein